ncbi:MAG: hypothetical protein SOT19_05905, partial [Muribaculaceae bacterium]|nr:hypothetical protein [Muribaculaceae bacterium]
HGMCRALIMLLCVVAATATARATDKPSEIYFSHTATGDWTFGHQAKVSSDGNSWFFTLQATSSDLYMQITNQNPVNGWNDLKSWQAYSFNDPLDRDNNAKFTFGENRSIWLTSSNKCIHLTGLTAGKDVTFKITWYENGDLRMTAYDPEPPANVFFHFNAIGNDWTTNVAARTDIADGKTWYTDITPTNDQIYLFVTDNSITDNWNNTLHANVGAFYPRAANDGDIDCAYGKRIDADKIATGRKNCMRLTGFEIGKPMRIALVYDNGRYSIYTGRTGETTLYMHFEEDYLKEGRDHSKLPYCHIFSTSGPGYLGWQSPQEEMRIVDNEHQVMAYTFHNCVIDLCNRVNFSFPGIKGGLYEYESGWKSMDYFDEANWTKFIYAVHTDKVAVQTYMTWDDFLAEKARGYQKLYVTGGAQNGSFKLTYDNGTTTDLGWDPANATVVDYCPEVSPAGVFFMKLVPEMGTDNTARFKMSWIDVAKYKNGKNKQNDQRDWATYDMGIIGVDDITCAANKDAWGDFLADIGRQDGWDTGRCTFFINKALPILEYNQFDWTLSNADSKYGVTSGETYWLVVDMHPECRTVTLCSFDPNPQLRVSPSTISTVTLSPDLAETLQANVGHFAGSEANGHIVTTRANRIDAKLNIIGGKDKYGADVSKEKFAFLATDAQLYPPFDVFMNSEPMFSTSQFAPQGYIPDPNKCLAVNYMPMADNNSISISASYRSKVTGLTFHVRPGYATVNGSATFPAPAKQDVTGTFVPHYVYSGKDDPAKWKGDAYFHVLGEVPFQLNGNAGNLAYYPDFSINGSTSILRDEHYDIMDTQGITGLPQAWGYTPYAHNSGWNEGSNNWSDMIRSYSKFPVIVQNHHHCAFGNGTIDVPAARYDGHLYAVYPVVYKKRPTVTIADEAAKAPAAVRARADEAINATDFALVNYTRDANVSIHADAKNNVDTGVEDIAADAATGDAAYYTLQGVRVQGQPAPGLYIRVAAGTATKVRIR